MMSKTNVIISGIYVAAGYNLPIFAVNQRHVSRKIALLAADILAGIRQRALFPTSLALIALKTGYFVLTGPLFHHIQRLFPSTGRSLIAYLPRFFLSPAFFLSSDLFDAYLFIFALFSCVCLVILPVFTCFEVVFSLLL